MLKKNFTKKDITNKVYQNLGFSKNLSLRIIDDFFETSIDILIKFKKIKISSFGTFQVIAKNERIGRNPKTKVEAKISARNVAKFKPSNIIKDKINS
jgi:integration host factor subunit alpha|tara:strand:- start:6 stop:296 length:291 start_codon:yes stop_codon:yes gene_type:complete